MRNLNRKKWIVRLRAVQMNKAMTAVMIVMMTSVKKPRDLLAGAEQLPRGYKIINGATGHNLLREDEVLLPNVVEALQPAPNQRVLQ
jgi:hypothetical protein